MAWIGALASVASSLMGASSMRSAMNQGRNDIRSLAQFTPAQFYAPNGFGISRQGFGAEGTMQRGLNDMTGQGSAGLMAGGMFNNPIFQQAFQNNDINSPFQEAQAGLQQQMPGSAFGGMGGMFNQNALLSNMFGQQAAAGPQDLTGGMQGALFGQGFQNLQNAGNQQGLMQQNLDASRAFAQPYEDRQTNALESRMFAQGRLGSTGGSQQFGDHMSALSNADNTRIMNAQQLGQGSQGLMQQLGLGQLGQAQGLMGQNLGQHQFNANASNMFSQGAMGAEGQQFAQILQALGQNQSAGQQRLGNAMSLFGLGNDTFNQSFGLGLQGQQQLTARDQLFANLFLGQQNAAAGRLGAGGIHSQALGSLAGGTASGMGGLFGGLGSALGGLLKGG